MSHACLSFSFSWFQLIGGDQQRGCQLKCLLGVEPKALIGQTQTLSSILWSRPKASFGSLFTVAVNVPGWCSGALSRYQPKFVLAIIEELAKCRYDGEGIRSWVEGENRRPSERTPGWCSGSEPLPVKIRVESVSVAVAIVAKAVIVACSNFARIRVRVATGRPVVAGRAVGIAAPVGLHVGAVLSVVSRNMDLGHGSDD